MSIKLVASDLDGTLLRPDHRLSEYTIDVLHRVHSLGIKIVAATGRGPQATWPVLEGVRHGVVDIALSSNGAIVLDMKTNTVAHRFPLDAADARSLVDRVRSNWPVAVMAWETAAGFGCDAEFPDRVPFLDEFELLPGDEIGDVKLDVDAEVTKLLISHPTLVKKPLMEAVSAMAPELVATSSGVDFVEVSGKGIDKAHGLRYLCSKWDIAADEVIAFGDNWNDMAMLDWAGTGVAMGHADPEVADAANHVIGSNADDAVATHLANLLL